MAMKGLHIFMCCLAAVALGAGNSVADGATLDSLIRVALENNPDVRAAEHDYQSSEYRSRAAGALPDPQLTVGVLNLPRTSLSFDKTPMSSVSIGLSQAIPWPGKLGAARRLSRFQTEGRGTALAARKNSVARTVASAYFDYSYWGLAREVLDQNLQLTRNLTEIAQTRYANGQASAQDVLRAQTAVSRMENRRLQMTRMQQSALIRLARLTDNPLTITAELPAALPLPSQAANYADSVGLVETNPLLAGASADLKASGEKLALAKADYWPNLMIGADYVIRKNTPMDPVRGEDFLTAKIGLSLPLWFFSKQKNRTRAAHEGVLAAEMRRHSLQRQIEEGLADSREQLSTILASLQQYDEHILPQANATVEAARVAYEVGRVDFNGWLAARRDLLDIELERLTLLNQYHQTRAVIAELVGEPYIR